MNIAFVSSVRLWGGVKTWMLEFGEELRRLGDGVFYFANEARLIERARAAGFHAERLRFGFDYNPATVLWFRRRFRALGIDLGVMNVQKELRTAGIAARLAGIPVVHRVGLPGDFTTKWDQRFAHRFLVARVLVTSSNMREDILARVPFIRPDKIAYVHNGRRPTAPPRTAPHRPVRFVITSRLERHKGHHDLLAALARVKAAEGPAFRCDVFSEGALRDELAARIVALGLSGEVTLRGFSANLAAELGGYDFGVLTSDYESLANTVLEYLAAALPSVTTNTGGVPEMVRDGHNGYLFAPGDVDALTGHLRRCVTLPDADYARLAANAHRTITEDFDLERQARRLQAFFREVAGRV